MLTTLTGADGQIYTLLPHNGWSVGGPLQWSRKWHTGISTGTKGGEARSSLRSLPLHMLACSFLAATLPESQRLDARCDQATKSGLGVMPFLGRAMLLANNAAIGDGSITLAAAPNWTWTQGDFIFIGNDAAFDAIEVTGTSGGGLVLALASNLANAWTGGATNVWPLLFGKFDGKKQTAVSGHVGHWDVSIEQLASERNAQLGTVTPPAGSGVGVDVVGTSNTVQ